MARFDVKRVNQLEWAGIVAAVVALIVVHAPWFVANGWGLDAAVQHGYGPAPTGWDTGFLVRAAVLLLAVGALVVLLPHLGIQVPWRPAIWIGTGAVAALLIPIGRNNFVSELGEYGYGPDTSIWFYVATGATWLAIAASVLNTRLARTPA